MKLKFIQNYNRSWNKSESDTYNNNQINNNNNIELSTKEETLKPFGDLYWKNMKQYWENYPFF